MRKLAVLSIVLIFAFISSIKCQDRYPIDERTTSAEFGASEKPAKKVTVNEWLTDKRAVLLFWTTWCPYCRTEIKSLNNLADELEAKGINVYFINVQETPSKVQRFAAKIRIDSPIVLDTRGSIAVRYRILGFPTYIFLENGVEIDRNNFISLKYIEKLYEQ